MTTRRFFSLGLGSILFASILSLAIVFGCGYDSSSAEREQQLQVTRPISVSEQMADFTLTVADLPQEKMEIIGMYRVAVKRSDGIYFSALSATQLPAGKQVKFHKVEYGAGANGTSIFFWVIQPEK